MSVENRLIFGMNEYINILFYIWSRGIQDHINDVKTRQEQLWAQNGQFQCVKCLLDSEHRGNCKVVFYIIWLTFFLSLFVSAPHAILSKIGDNHRSGQRSMSWVTYRIRLKSLDGWNASLIYFHFQKVTLMAQLITCALFVDGSVWSMTIPSYLS